MTLTYIQSFLLVFMALIFTNCQDKKEDFSDMFSQNEEKPYIQTFHLKTIDNKTIEIELIDSKKLNIKTKEYKNKIILFDFWATWCPSCVQEIPNLNNINKKYKKDLMVIGVSVDRDSNKKTMQDFIKKHNMQYTITTTLQNNDNIALMQNLTNIRTLPFKMLYDKNGNYISHYYGAMPEEILTIEIEKALK
jgi:thiol-disulfide isomerase/thioredoxin